LKPELDNADPNSPFYNKKVVITGIFNSYSRNDLADLLKEMGADINGSISKKTNFVIAGLEAGPAKMEKIKTLNKMAANIVLLNEPAFISILKSYQNSDSYHELKKCAE